MRVQSGKAKGRRLQATVAEALSRTHGLTIEAVPPTKPGAREHGATYVGEFKQPDLRVKRMGEAGADVVLLSQRAVDRVALQDTNGVWHPVWFECKNREGWQLDAHFWNAGRLAILDRAFEQTAERPEEYVPIVVLSRNRHPPLAVLPVEVPFRLRLPANLLDGTPSLMLPLPTVSVVVLLDQLVPYFGYGRP